MFLFPSNSSQYVIVYPKAKSEEPFKWHVLDLDRGIICWGEPFHVHKWNQWRSKEKKDEGQHGVTAVLLMQLRNINISTWTEFLGRYWNDKLNKNIEIFQQKHFAGQSLFSQSLKKNKRSIICVDIWRGCIRGRIFLLYFLLILVKDYFWYIIK